MGTFKYLSSSKRGFSQAYHLRCTPRTCEFQLWENERSSGRGRCANEACLCNALCATAIRMARIIQDLLSTTCAVYRYHARAWIRLNRILPVHHKLLKKVVTSEDDRISFPMAWLTFPASDAIQQVTRFWSPDCSTEYCCSSTSSTVTHAEKFSKCNMRSSRTRQRDFERRDKRSGDITVTRALLAFLHKRIFFFFFLD